VGPSSKLYSPVLLGHEYESSPMMPGDLRVPVGRKQTFIATHLEVMAVIHTESGSDGLPSDDDASEPTPEDGNNKNDDLGWTTVSHKGQRTRSASREKRRHSKVLDDELNHVVRKAKRGLTPDDRVRINKRITALKNRPAGRQGDETSETTSRGEGPSAFDKGKGIDPRNWGALSENGNDLDLDGQRAALESWNLARDITHSSTADSEEGSSGPHLPKKNKHEQNNKHAREVSAREAKLVSSREAKPKGREQPDKPVKNKHQSKNEKHKDTAERRNLSPVKAMVERAVTLSDKPQRRHHTPKAMEPVEQIDPNSYIGLAFKHLERKRKPTGRRHQKGSSSYETSSNSSGSSDGSSSEDDDSSDSSSGSSDSSSASDKTSSSSSSSTSQSPSRRRGHRNRSRCRGRSRRRSESRRARRKSR